MSWVSSTATRSVPLPEKDTIGILPIAGTQLLVHVTAVSIAAYHTCTLLPLAHHTRPKESLDAHGPFQNATVQYVAGSGSDPQVFRPKSATVFVRTTKNYTLIYNVAINAQKSAFEVVGADGVTLQNSLPIAQAQQSSLGAMFRMATKTLLHGATSSCNLANLEHFSYQGTDDECRNESVPQIRLLLVKVIKVSSPMRCLWGKRNSHNLILHNEPNQLQLLNYKTLRTKAVDLDDYAACRDARVLEYCVQDNSFLSMNGSGAVSLVHVASVEEPGDGEHEVTLSVEALGHVDAPLRRVVFSPDSSMVLFVVANEPTELQIHHLSAQEPRLRLVHTITMAGCRNLECVWAPCGTFFVCLDTDSRFWRMYSKFGAILFDSEVVSSEIDGNQHFCRASHFAICQNAMALYLVSHDSIYKVDLVRALGSSHKFDSFPLLYGKDYVSIPYSEQKSHMKTPMMPVFQKVLSQMQYASSKSGFGKLSMQLNAYEQLSMSYGSVVCLSTPTCLGSVPNHVLWYQFYNHSTSGMNIVHHFWLDDFMVLINRFSETEDEMMILDTCGSKFGNIGREFRFDSDVILWRHTFKNHILCSNVSENHEGGQTLVFLASDFRLHVMETEARSLEDPERRRVLRASKTIHLSSIKNKLALTNIMQMINIHEKHFFFLLSTGEVYLLKNQSLWDSGTQPRNMYELVLIRQKIERMELTKILGGTEDENSKKEADNTNDEQGKTHAKSSPQKVVLSLCSGNRMQIYHLHDLLEISDTEEMAAVRPVTIEVAGFFPLWLSQKSTQGEKTLEVLGIEYSASVRSKHLLVRPRAGRLLVLDEFIQRDLTSGKELSLIEGDYGVFDSYAYALELLLFKSIENEQLGPVISLTRMSPKKNHILVNFLRKIDASLWSVFFDALQSTPLEFMNELFSCGDVELCYAYLTVYLNYKRENDEDLLGENETSVVVQILRMLKQNRQWDRFLELCRFIKFLQPEGSIFEEIQLVANDRNL